jgi:hypothetical protein
MWSCKELEYPQKFPIIFTEEIGNINSEGAEFIGNVKSLGSNQNIINYGFVWDDSEMPTINSSRLYVTDEIQEGKFSRIINGGLFKGKLYYVRAFIQTDHLVVYGDQVTFTSEGSLPPKIIDFTPKKGFDGTEITIVGRNFNPSINGNGIRVGGLACEVISATDSVLKVKSPQSELVGDYKITVSTTGKSAVSEIEYTILGPRIRSISKFSGRVGDMLTVEGEYFDIGNNMDLYFGSPEQWVSNESHPYVMSPGLIECYVPDLANTAREIELHSSLNSNQKTFTFPGNFSIVNSWEKISDQTPLGYASGFSSALVDGHLYFIGDTLLYEFYPSTNTWIRKMDFPGSPRYNGAAFVVNNKLYYGFGEASFDGSYYNDLWMFDPTSNSWKFIMNAPIKKRSRLTYFAINNKAYLGFGFARVNLNGIYYDDFWEFDPISLAWTPINSPIEDGDGTLSPISFELGNKGYVVGLKLRQVWQFDPSNFKWERKSDFTGESGGPVTASETRGFIFSGGEYGGGNRVYEYDPVKDRWIKRQTFPGRGRYSAVAGWINGKVYFGTGEYSNADFWELSLD